MGEWDRNTWMDITGRCSDTNAGLGHFGFFDLLDPAWTEAVL